MLCKIAPNYHYNYQLLQSRYYFATFISYIITDYNDNITVCETRASPQKVASAFSS